LCGLADITVAAGPLKWERKTAVRKVHKGEARVADPESGAFLTSGYGMGKKSGSGSGMNNPDHISESSVTIFWIKIL
jgi:hypothetical protein